MMANDWDWNPEKQKSIVVQQVDAIAVYVNVRGEVVIRQQGPQGEEDAVISFPKSYAAVIIAAIKAEAGLS
jgi:hypothetical protein